MAAMNDQLKDQGGHGDCHDHTKCSTKGVVATQSLTELDFDRGIWSAAMNNEIERLDMLITKGHLNDRDSCGYTALHYAARSGHHDACLLLLSRGLGVDEVTNGGVTALHRAAMMGHSKIVQLLLAHDANPLHRDNDGRTALHRAAENGHLLCCQLLVQRDPTLCRMEDARQQKPIDLVREHQTNSHELRNLLAG
ncbi:ankyrin repeat domain-containing protein 39 [Anopheles nili]|uniref:ankyrin repeat domain-containing protein 39 n=1 Tax=Anopheles nili TaxID=185578 RepID=UPI00237B6B11|nr:ankyrin repeat domain-containing protein 39 [Anopheles nili]